MAARKQSGTRDKRVATTQPVQDVTELRGFWDRLFDPEGYRELVVEVIGRQNNELFFFVLDSEGARERHNGGNEFSINLDDGSLAWSSLPSTAQWVDPESSQRIGYLFVTEVWIKENLGAARLKSGGAKWPKNTSL
jgi:hypothetical protein